MIYRQYTPVAPLSHYIDWIWFYSGLEPRHTKEHVLPDGTFELVINLHEEVRHVFDRDHNEQAVSYRKAWLSGTHSRYIVIDAVPGSSMMGVHFRPGGAGGFLRCNASEFVDQVVELEAIWGAEAGRLRDRLIEASPVHHKFEVLESFLFEQLRAVDLPPVRTDWALRRMMEAPEMTSIRTVADRLGISHKHFVQEFREQVGLTPKLFCRIRRFQKVLQNIGRSQHVEWADLASQCGYFDQAHFIRDFQSFCGLDPSAYLDFRRDTSNFVPLPD